MKKAGIIIVIVALIALLAGAFWGGYKYYPKKNPCPEVVVDTFYVEDTTTHTIPDKPPEYIVKWRDRIVRDKAWIDSIVEANRVDTANILADFYDLFIYERAWGDSLITVNLIDTISQNMPIGNIFTYKILRPQQIIQQNTYFNTNYARYVYLGVDIPATVNSFNPELLYAFRRGYMGIGYQSNQKTISLKAGIILFQMR